MIQTQTQTLTDAEVYGRQIASRRCAIGLKRKDLASAAGISYPYLAEIENGKKMPTHAVQKALAAVLNAQVSDLLAAPSQAPSAGEPTMSDLMAEIRALRRLVEELAARG